MFVADKGQEDVPMYTVTEFAELLGVPVPTLEEWDMLHFGPLRIRINGKVGYLASDIEKFMHLLEWTYHENLRFRDVPKIERASAVLN